MARSRQNRKISAARGRQPPGRLLHARHHGLDAGTAPASGAHPRGAPAPGAPAANHQRVDTAKLQDGAATAEHQRSFKLDVPNSSRELTMATIAADSVLDHIRSHENEGRWKEHVYDEDWMWEPWIIRFLIRVKVVAYIAGALFSERAEKS